MRKYILVGIAAMLSAGLVMAQTAKKGSSSSISYGKVAAVETVKLDNKGATAGGALIGGMAGVATQHGRGHDEKLAGAAAGALLGGLLTKTATGKRKAEAFTVNLNGGSTVKVVQDMADIVVGDCVAIEQGETANIRRVADEMCVKGEHLADASIAASHQQDAQECQQAKQEVLKAGTDAEFSRAEKKVQILCS
jgi:outer membrane lipoprotein SlyB